jgi:hypothetical protein
MIDYATAFTNFSGAFPNIVAVNASGGGATDGTEYIKAFIDDLWGENQAIMDFAGFTPNAIAEAAGSSQRLDAILKFIKPIVVDVTADVTLSDERPRQLVKAVKQAADITITLPDASSGNFIGQTIIIDVTGTGAGSVLMATTSSQTVDGLTPGNFDFIEAGQKEFTSDGANWISMRNTSREAKAWVNFDGTGTVAIRSAENVSSITDNGTADYQINFSNSVGSATYSYFGSGESNSAINGDVTVARPNGGVKTDTALEIRTQTSDGASADMPEVCISVFGL